MPRNCQRLKNPHGDHALIPARGAQAVGDRGHPASGPGKVGTDAAAPAGVTRVDLNQADNTVNSAMYAG